MRSRWAPTPSTISTAYSGTGGAAPPAPPARTPAAAPPPRPAPHKEWGAHSLDDLDRVLGHRRVGPPDALGQHSGGVQTPLVGLEQDVERPLAGLGACSHGNSPASVVQRRCGRRQLTRPR